MISMIVRAFTLLWKELLEVLRQPALILALVMGPFLILLIFGIGHRAQKPPLVTILVVPAGSTLTKDTEFWRDRFGPSATVVGVTNDAAAARQNVEERRADLAIIVPGNAAEEIQAGRRAVIQVMHNRIDPVDEAYVGYVAYVVATELNQQIGTEVVGTAQERVRENREIVQELRAELQALQETLRAGNLERSRDQIRKARADVDTVRAQLQSTSQFLVAAGALSPNPDAAESQERLQRTQEDLDRLSQSLAELEQEADANPQAALTRTNQIEADLAQIEQTAELIDPVPAELLVRPFAGQVESVAPFSPDFVAFYSPGVLALLLQHMAVTFTALSLIREKLLGTIEMYEVAPTNSASILAGKYVSYGILSVAVALVLTGLMTQLLGVPLLGDPLLYWATLTLVIFASLGLGLVISLLSASEQQAVQFSMLVLLASVFFSGFFLGLETLQLPASAVSLALPVTYGILALKDVMLHGALGDTFPLLALGGLGLFFLILSWLLLRRTIQRA